MIYKMLPILSFVVTIIFCFTIKDESIRRMALAITSVLISIAFILIEIKGKLKKIAKKIPSIPQKESAIEL